MQNGRISALIVLAALPLTGQLKPVAPAAAEMAASGLEAAASLIGEQVNRRQVGAAALLVARRGESCSIAPSGISPRNPRHRRRGRTPFFWVASITKPVTACALMLLVERGLVGLSDPVKQYIPEFQGEERDKVRVLDLLKHTSGLPDMLPENTALRRALTLRSPSS